MKSKSPDSNLEVHGKGRSGVHIKSSAIFFMGEYQFSNMKKIRRCLNRV